MFSYLKKISLQLKNGRKHSRINRQIFHQLNLRTVMVINSTNINKTIKIELTGHKKDHDKQYDVGNPLLIY
jgi:hypothetical protein